MGYIKNCKWYMIFGPIFKLLEAISELINPLIVARIIDEGVSGGVSVIWKYGLLVLVVNILALGFSIAGSKCSSLASSKIASGMRLDLFNKISQFSHAELDKFGTASMVNRLTNDINQIENSVGIFMRTLLRVPLLLIGALVLSVIINVKMSLVFLVLIPFVCIVLFIYMKKTSPYFSVIRDKLDKIGKVTKENLSGTRVIRAFNKQKDEQQRFGEVLDDYTKTSIHVVKISSLLNPLILLIVDIAILGILSLGAWQINIGGMTQGEVIALINYVSMITISLMLLAHIIVIFVRTIASVKRVNEVFKTEVTIKEKENGKKLKPQDLEVLMEFNQVGFNYTQDIKDKMFIENLSFKILPNQTVGIIGGTGSGKTTIANLMTRFYDATLGEVYYKGRNIKDYTLKQLRDEVSVVQQRSTLFAGSLRDNMRLRNAEATDEEIIEALKISQAWSFVSEWSNGLDHQIMAGGKNVSGGQMQRLTIARALIGKPDMIILDDSSSALDFLTDYKLRQQLKKLKSTYVYISQRATSIQHADLIIVLDNGMVVGMGKHKDLLKNCEIYKEIYESQSK